MWSSLMEALKASVQDGKPVCYASRSLSDTESRHSNIERESFLLVVGP